MNMLFACTLTGVDEFTDLKRLEALSDEYKFAEWGVLWSQRPEEGGNRYVSHDTAFHIAETMYGSNVKLALHVCGKAVLDFLEPRHDIHAVAAGFGRVQLNFNDRVSPIDLERLDEALENYHGKIITQHNAANSRVSLAVTSPDHHVLFDASGGRGLYLDEFPERLPGKLCGYAGGFGPDTISEDVRKAELASGGADYWIDMETKLRTDDIFDLDICAKVLKTVSERVVVSV